MSCLFLFLEEAPDFFRRNRCQNLKNYFQHKLFDISQCRFRIVGVSKVSNNDKFAVKVPRFFDLKTKHQHFLKKVNSTSGEELAVLQDNLRDFLKAYEQATKTPHVPLPRTKIQIGSNYRKRISLLTFIKIFVKNGTVKSVYLSVWKKTSASFPPRSSTSTVINCFSHILLTLKVTTLTKIAIL